jgi:hypothetical protein
MKGKQSRASPYNCGKSADEDEWSFPVHSQAMQLQTKEAANRSDTSAPNAATVKPGRTRMRGGAKLVTIGFPAEDRHKTKRVNFDPPISARCLATDGKQTFECEVMTVWATGAHLRVKQPSYLDEFVLLFAWSPTVVSRRCKRLWCRGEEVCVEYVKTRRSYSLEHGR